MQLQKRIQVQPPAVLPKEQSLIPRPEKGLTPLRDFQNFLSLAYIEIKPSNGAKLMKLVYGLLVLIFISYFGKSYSEIIQAIYNALGLSGIVIILLFIAFLSLLMLLEGARRLRNKESNANARTVSDLDTEWQNCVSGSIKVSEIRGRGKQLFRLLIEKVDVPRGFLEEWRSLIEHNAKCSVPEIPESSSQWAQWVSSCEVELNKHFPNSPIVRE
ncbi:MAG TPA: hypothetical protein VF297_00805 [Pyrinomonadaceae bacterium]